MRNVALPCSAAPDDVFEENDDCGSAVPLPLGSHPNLHVKSTDLDYYLLTIPGQSFLTITMTSGNGDVWMTGFQPCFTQITGSSSTSFSISNTNTSDTTFVLEVRSNGVLCSDYGLDLTATLDPCLGVADDAFEDNDTCADAVPLAPGTYTHLVVTNGDDDYYSVTLLAGERMLLTETADSFFACYTLWDPACTTRLADGEVAMDFTNVSGQTQTYVLKASQCTHGLPSCSVYGFDLTIQPSDCLTAGDDSFEPNDDCTGAIALANGTFVDLAVNIWSPDFYKFCVPDGGTFDASLFFSDAQGDIDLYLFDSHRSLCGIVSPGSSLLDSASNTDNEHITWYNSFGTATDVTLMVVMDSAEFDPCNTYDLTISGGAGCVGALVTSYCRPMDPNSTGFPTYLSASHGWAAESGLRLQAFGGPPNELAFFLVGTGASSPGLSTGDGRLCLSTNSPHLIGRYNITGTNLDSLGRFDAQGIFQNLSGTASLGSGFDVPWQLPLAGSPTIQLGETWYFQLWHRDGTGRSNFSDAAAVRF